MFQGEKTWAAFYDAANQAEGDVIALLQLVESMFELGGLSEGHVTFALSVA